MRVRVVILGMVGVLLAVLLFASPALAVDPDMQALVIDNGSDAAPPVVPAPSALISVLIGLGGIRALRLGRSKA